MKRELKWLITFLLISCVSCSTPSGEMSPTNRISEKECIDFIPPDVPNEFAFDTVVQPFSIQASSGNTIHGLIRRPDPEKYLGKCFPAVILVPGGINPGRLLAHGKEAKVLAGSGMVVVTFNAEGRADSSNEDILSEGTEDYNGFRHQDGLCEIVEFVMGLSSVSPNNIGIASQSYGITMSAGCAGRYPDLPIKYLVDGEGPPYSFVTCHGPRYLAGNLEKYNSVKKIFNRLAVWQDESEDNRAWWSEREAINFIGNFNSYYLRLQAEWDHAQPPENQQEMSTYHHPNGWLGGGPPWWYNKHTADIVNAAIEGGVPWVRVNLKPQSNSVNATYSVDNMPEFLPGKLADKPWSVLGILEMVNMKPLQ